MNTLLAILLVLLSVSGRSDTAPQTLARGSQPQVSVDTKGVIRIVYGTKDQIFCLTSADNGKTFTKPALVARITGMHLGMTRGPQIASSNRYSIITAIDKSGNIHSFRLSHQSKKWERMQPVNDLEGSGPEGLMSISADERDNFYAVWLDIRQKKQNQIFFSSLQSGAQSWSKNRLIYESPSGHVCECCKPSVATAGSQVAVMFRNWLFGSRDLYFITSANQGRSFSAARKLGTGTWKLNACPMDGGDISIDRNQQVHSAWQRQGAVYYSKPGQGERKIESGRNVSMVKNAKTPTILFHSGGKVFMSILNGKPLTIGEGSFAEGVVTPDHKILVVWENEGSVLFRKVG